MRISDWSSDVCSSDLGLVIENFSDIYYAARDYVHTHAAKVLIALVLTVPISLWIIKNRSDELEKPTNHRKIAIVLALFLGWLAAHRFYLGQIGCGLFYLIILYLFAPLVIILGQYGRASCRERWVRYG